MDGISTEGLNSAIGKHEVDAIGSNINKFNTIHVDVLIVDSYQI